MSLFGKNLWSEGHSSASSPRVEYSGRQWTALDKIEDNLVWMRRCLVTSRCERVKPRTGRNSDAVLPLPRWPVTSVAATLGRMQHWLIYDQSPEHFNKTVNDSFCRNHLS
ncbi:hypothetical protein MCOR02_007077 [Pyricularia oryzae]|uniref:Uncharacterized protein n=1 Tax=Pyricularia grisea TaxID=148305 RepID=A0ABQ8NL11_PYRGI|nr:hypothetical protein MCOR02_007077 [Pyricularia oryzae]KAI6297820.1 hypothetical protein MCOR33_005913 [Pyricularia grisea]KAI6326130.1 hypothetical protein MCOR34_000905 [Pyricularia oryzae]KAI6468505.1 hypothetical protein MCOR17_004110 [Pyricularia oryzae]KAI6508008.1 hypothetical protein MCOR13_002439 [Pyricularia oryzae]